MFISTLNRNIVSRLNFVRTYWEGDLNIMSKTKAIMFLLFAFSGPIKSQASIQYTQRQYPVYLLEDVSLLVDNDNKPREA